jgi:hypothetical protein
MLRTYTHLPFVIHSSEDEEIENMLQNKSNTLSILRHIPKSPQVSPPPVARLTRFDYMRVGVSVCWCALRICEAGRAFTLA